MNDFHCEPSNSTLSLLRTIYMYADRFIRLDQNKNLFIDSIENWPWIECVMKMIICSMKRWRSEKKETRNVDDAVDHHYRFVRQNSSFPTIGIYFLAWSQSTIACLEIILLLIPENLLMPMQEENAQISLFECHCLIFLLRKIDRSLFCLIRSNELLHQYFISSAKKKE